MLKVLRFTEYLYLIVAVLSIVKIADIYFNGAEGNLTLFAIFAVVSIGMFFFRRTYRKKFENRQNNS